jgi:hypothetical protein
VGYLQVLQNAPNLATGRVRFDHIHCGSRKVQVDILDLNQFLWKNRLLFIFAPDRNHPDFSDLHQSLKANRDQIAERDLVVFEILESGPARMNSELLALDTAQMLRKKVKAPSGEFTVILVGKDGGVKLNRHERTELKDIFGLIDSMPMRQDEVRQKNRKH